MAWTQLSKLIIAKATSIILEIMQNAILAVLFIW